MTEGRPHVAILGAGPIGMEAALACVERGLPFTLYEAGERVGTNVLRWGHVHLFTPWRLNVSDRMRRHLPAGVLPADEEDCPIGEAFVSRVLEPLARVPSVAPRLRTGVQVVAVGREGLLKHHEIGTGRRSHHPFRLLLRGRGGEEWAERADVVLDCTGTYHRPNPVGDGGIPAPGEAACAAWIRREIPDLASEEDWRDRTVLLVGAGHSAQTAARDLAAAADGGSGTRVVWAVRSPEPAWGAVEDDPLRLRAELTCVARELAAGGSRAVEPLTGTVVSRLEPRKDGVRVELRSTEGDRRIREVDRVLSLTGSVGDPRIYRQLQVHECYATSGPMKLAAALLGSNGQDCLAQESHGAETLTNPEPGFFLLGEKSYGRNNTFLMRVGWRQVDEVSGLLAG